MKLESPSAPPEVVQKAVEDKLRALGVDTSQVSVSPSSERDGFIDVEVNGETRSFNVGGVTSAEVAANLQGHLKDFLGEHYSQNSQILNLDQRLNQYRFDDNRERAKFNTEAAFEAGIVRGQLQTKYANEAMMAQIKATSFHIDNQAELSDYFATYDRSLEIAGQRAFTGDALNVGLALTTFAAGGAATWAGWGGIGVISQGAGKGFGALKSGLGWTVNGVSNVARTLGGNFSKHGIKGIYATGSYYGSSIQTGGVILADIVAGEGVGLASYGFASYATAKLAYSNRGQILSGISEGFRSVGKFVDGISAQFSMSFRSVRLGVSNNQTIANASSGNFKELLPTSSLNNRQLAIHEALTEQGAVGQFHKKFVSMTDLKAITQVTGDEYNMFTLGSQRTIITGINGVRAFDLSFDMYLVILIQLAAQEV